MVRLSLILWLRHGAFLSNISKKILHVYAYRWVPEVGNEDAVEERQSDDGRGEAKQRLLLQVSPWHFQAKEQFL